MRILSTQTRLHMLSELLHEELASDIVTAEPNSFERQLEELVRAPEFVNGIIAMDKKMQKADVQTLWDTIVFCWVEEVHTLLVTEDKIILNGSDAVVACFVQCQPSGNRFWLQTGRLGTPRETELIQKFSKLIVQMMRAGGMNVNLDMLLLSTMLECWNSGPGAIQSALEQGNVQVPSGIQKPSHGAPGSLVHVSQNELVRHSLSSTFDVGDRVCVVHTETDEQQPRRYKFATVLDAEGEDLSKQYTLNIGVDSTMQIGHHGLYQMSRTPVPRLSAEGLKGGELALRSNQAQPAEDSSETDANLEWLKLHSHLKQVTYSADQWP